MAASGVQYEIDVERLTYNHTHSAPPSLSNVFIKLPKGSRTILVGANGGELGFLLFKEHTQRLTDPLQLANQLCYRF